MAAIPHVSTPALHDDFPPASGIVHAAGVVVAVHCVSVALLHSLAIPLQHRGCVHAAAAVQLGTVPPAPPAGVQQTWPAMHSAPLQRIAPPTPPQSGGVPVAVMHVAVAGGTGGPGHTLPVSHSVPLQQISFVPHVFFAVQWSGVPEQHTFPGVQLTPLHWMPPSMRHIVPPPVGGAHMPGLAPAPLHVLLAQLPPLQQSGDPTVHEPLASHVCEPPLTQHTSFGAQAPPSAQLVTVPPAHDGCVVPLVQVSGAPLWTVPLHVPLAHSPAVVPQQSGACAQLPGAAHVGLPPFVIGQHTEPVPQAVVPSQRRTSFAQIGAPDGASAS